MAAIERVQCNINGSIGIPDAKRPPGPGVAWFNRTAPGGTHPLPYLTRAGMAHFYFVSIHPFEDGNGRIGRALAEKSLAQGLGRPTLIALAFTIERARKAYYEMLERSNKANEITAWLSYFCADGS
jgi:Fic family protein